LWLPVVVVAPDFMVVVVALEDLGREHRLA
jgi:hypothetical protein